MTKIAKMTRTCPLVLFNFFKYFLFLFFRPKYTNNEYLDVCKYSYGHFWFWFYDNFLSLLPSNKFIFFCKNKLRIGYSSITNRLSFVSTLIATDDLNKEYLSNKILAKYYRRPHNMLVWFPCCAPKKIILTILNICS